MSDSLTLEAIRDSLQSSRQDAIRSYRQSLRPDALLAALSRCADQTLNKLLERYPLPEGATLAAVGGYGRGELFPFSDVDLLILLQGEPDSKAEASLSGLVAAMWDVGLEPGYSVRTIEQCVKEARADITVETSLLESRWIAGNKSLAKVFSQTMTEHLDAKQFFRAKRAEMQQRHARFQDTPYSLEPNCKESPGGLRDLQVIMWMARAAGFGSSWQAIARAGLLTSAEARDLKRAEQAFKRVRIELHLLVNRREDRLLFDLQHGLAQAYNIAATATRRASELLMQRYYWAARLVTQLNTLLVQNIEERLFALQEIEARVLDENYISRHYRLDIQDELLFEKSPSQLLNVFLVLQQHPELTELSGRALRAIWHARDRINAAFRRDPVNQALFLKILQQPHGIVHALRRMTMLNILPRYLPVFRRVVGQMQHDLFHVYTVDQHILMVLRNVRRFFIVEHAHEYPFCSQLASGWDKPWLLYVAALFHDIAKGRGGDHSDLGKVEVRRFCKQHAIPHEDAQLVEFLVGEHLTMSHIAQKADLSDPDVISKFAKRVGNERNLTALYLLTVADIRGTSPKVWNAWKSKLLEELYRYTMRVLGGRAPDAAAEVESRKREALILVALYAMPFEAHKALWDTLDVSYFMRHDAPDIAWHTKQLSRHVNTPTPVVRARHSPVGEGLQVLVYTQDQPDLFARICGYFDQASFSILDARVHTTHHGYALDTFQIVTSAGMQEHYQALTSMLENDLALAIANAGPLPAPSKGRVSRRVKSFPIAPRVTLRPDEKAQNWLLNISASDRLGLLYSVARVLARHKIEVQLAKVATLGERVDDTFLIHGAQLQFNKAQIEIETELLEALSD